MARDLKNLEGEHQRKQTLAQRYLSEWQDLRYAESQKQGQLKDKLAWEQSIKDKRKEIEVLTAEMKVSRMISECTTIPDVFHILVGTRCEDLREHCANPDS